MPTVKKVICQKERICSTCKNGIGIGKEAIKDKRSKDKRTKYYCGDDCYKDRQR